MKHKLFIGSSIFLATLFILSTYSLVPAIGKSEVSVVHAQENCAWFTCNPEFNCEQDCTITRGADCLVCGGGGGGGGGGGCTGGCNTFTYACPATGQTGSQTSELCTNGVTCESTQTITDTCACPSGQHLNGDGTACVSDTCETPPSTTNLGCPAGYSGTHTQTTTYSGPSCTPSTTDDNQCTLNACPGSSTTDVGCPAGYHGTHTQTTSYSNPPTCSASTSDNNQCVANPCQGPTTVDIGCPAGYSGSHTQTTSYSNPPTCSASAPVDNNSCTPTSVTVSVTNNTTGSWTVNPGSLSGSGSGAVHPTPSPSGTSYTIAPSAVSGYNYPPAITNSVTGSGSSFVLFPGQNGSFTISYSPSFNYSLSAPAAATPNPIVKGGSGHSSFGQVTITKSKTAGSAEPVYLTLSGVPAGVSYDLPGGGGCTPDPSCASIINFTVTSDASVGPHTITVTGSAPAHSVTFNLDIDKSPDIEVSSCSASGSPGAVLLGQPITWLASGVTGGTGTGYSSYWTGLGIPASPAPTANPYTVTYSTIGAKFAVFHVTDSNGNVGTCTTPTVQVNFNPNSKEI